MLFAELIFALPHHQKSQIKISMYYIDEKGVVVVKIEIDDLCHLIIVNWLIIPFLPESTVGLY